MNAARGPRTQPWTSSARKSLLHKTRNPRKGHSMSLPRPGHDGIPLNAIVHSCGSWWTGTRRVHCPADNCHLTFSSETAANKHRTGTFGTDRKCTDPTEAGLVPRTAKFGTVWCCPGPEADNDTAAWRPTDTDSQPPDEDAA